LPSGQSSTQLRALKVKRSCATPAEDFRQ
jgi:hypothetical protein